MIKHAKDQEKAFSTTHQVPVSKHRLEHNYMWKSIPYKGFQYNLAINSITKLVHLYPCCCSSFSV